MALKKSGKKSPKKTEPNKQVNEVLQIRLDHYKKGIEDMEMRKTRQSKGWDSVIDAFMNKLPANWPYTSRVTDPRIRTTILEKTARLLNGKLRGRLVPREGSDIVKARINNAVLEFQWDNANEGGSMIEKVAKADMIARLFGAAFTLNYWDDKKNCNEMKVLDPRDVFVDYTADHIRNARWVQYREYTTLDDLEARGYDVTSLRRRLEDKFTTDREHLSQVKQNRGLEERIGQDKANPVVELITEITPTERYIFLPRYNEMLDEGPNPYNHQQINLSQLRYYPLLDDLYGESEVEPVISLSRAINAVLCGFIDTMNLAMRPPIKLLTGESRQDTIVFNPGARWILNNIQSGQEVQIGDTAIKAFNNTYPALVAAFNTAMGDQSLGVSNIVGRGNDPKTATEIRNLESQQNSRDQYNQLYLSEFLKDVMLQWLANNQQYLFDDPTQKYRLLKIVGRDSIKDLQQLGLDQYEVPSEAIHEIADAQAGAGLISDTQFEGIIQDVQVPRYPVIKNPNDDPEQYEIVPKLKVKGAGSEAELHLSPDDLTGVFDYIPDVKSMAAGAGQQMQQARQLAMQSAKEFREDLATEGQKLKVSELLINVFEDAGYKDAESLFESIQAGPGLAPGGQFPGGAAGPAGLPAPAGVPVPPGGPELAGPQEAQTVGIA